MQRKPLGYILLSFLSFTVFTAVFHTVALAETSERIPAPSNTPSVATLPPTPTVWETSQPPVQIALQSISPTPEATVTKPPQPTPTIYIAPTKAPEPTVAPTSIPTVIPTAAPQLTIAPTATPQPKPAVAAPADLDPFFDKYASEYSIDKEDLKRIAKCEAGFNPNADTGLYAGMYQFHAQTWASTRNAMGLDPSPDLRKNAEESIRTAAFKIKNGGRGAWPNC